MLVCRFALEKLFESRAPLHNFADHSFARNATKSGKEQLVRRLPPAVNGSKYAQITCEEVKLLLN